MEKETHKPPSYALEVARERATDIDSVREKVYEMFLAYIARQERIRSIKTQRQALAAEQKQLEEANAAALEPVAETMTQIREMWQLKSLDFGTVSIKTVARQRRLQITDIETLAVWLRLHGEEDCIKPTAIYLNKLKKLVKDIGYTPPGVEELPPDDPYSVTIKTKEFTPAIKKEIDKWLLTWTEEGDGE